MNKVVTSVSEMHIDDDGILCIKIKKGVVISLEKMKEHLLASAELLEGRKALTLIEGASRFTMTDEANKYLASEKGAENRIAAAFVTNSFINKLWFNFYLKFRKPVTPTKMFNSAEAGIEWLKTFYVMPGDKFERKKRK